MAFKRCDAKRGPIANHSSCVNNRSSQQKCLNHFDMTLLRCDVQRGNSIRAHMKRRPSQKEIFNNCDVALMHRNKQRRFFCR